MNKKGITLIEIIISIVLISIVLIFLFSLLITVQDINYESEVNSMYLINKSLFIKTVEEDFDKAKSIVIDDSSCNINQIYSNYEKPNSTEFFQKDGVNPDKLKAKKCIQIKYTWQDNTTDTGVLAIFYKNNHNNIQNNVISYIRDDIAISKELPEFENIDKNLEMNWSYNNFDDSNIKGFKVINIPIIGNDGKDYSLNLSYYQK